MLKSTYQPAAPLPPLPAGWTEHKAPTGHPYYYNAVTQQSTYSRPTDVSFQPRIRSEPSTLSDHFSGVSTAGGLYGYGEQNPPRTGERSFQTGQRPISGGFRCHDPRERWQAKDRPKSKHPIPGCEPWVLVTTKLGRRFVYNLEKNESFWKFPPDVMKAVVEFDKMERERKEQDQDNLTSGTERPEALHAEQTPTTEQQGPLLPNGQRQQERPVDESDEYEEVEVTDDEEDDKPASKRQKSEEDGRKQPVEFDENDIAYQLAAMGQDYGLDPGEYGGADGEELEEGAEGLPLSDEDASALFKDMLNDHHINPYNPWDKLIEEGHIIEDDRYTLLPNMKTRKEIWGEWSLGRIQKLKELREQEEKKDPLIPYLKFLQVKATPKLYWPEFRRKYMKEPEMRNTKLSDKEREKWYRDYINRLKLPESTLKSDLVSLLKSIPLRALNQSSSMAALPPTMLTNLYYIALRPSVRDPLIETHISTLSEAPDTVDDPEEQGVRMKEKQEREQRKALAERHMQVQREQKRAKETLEYSRGMLREGEREVQQAMKVGKEGLLLYMEKDEQPPLPPAGEVP
ncbi:MAG: hypothetical protein Q9209_007026 [Squamulea sp. 1 TL-2023]